MKISLKWIKEYVDVPDLPNNLQAFCDKLDLTGTGVEEVIKLGQGYDNIVTGKVLSKEPHPDSDHMYITKVDVGETEPLQIVCGAQNFEAGNHIVVAKIGAVLPGDFKIKKAKLRGVESCGMNCSEEELGLADKSDGIMILSDDAPIGVPVADYLKLSDVILDTEITPNRPDCLSVVGCAREIASIYAKEYSNPLDKMASKINDFEIKKEKMPKVEIVDEQRCPRYSARVIKGVKIGPSPKWLVERLNAMGTRSINNVVDATNYILFLFGQPLHAFDYDKISNGDDSKIIVRPAAINEKFTTLDNEERTLNPDMTVISTEKEAVALAGVMGGLNSEVNENTTSILLETATFSPAHTSRTSRNLGLISESSMRFERRVDDFDIDKISDASAALIMELAGGYLCSENGKLDGSIVDVWPIKTEMNELDFRVNRFNTMMGAEISIDFIKETLSNLGCQVNTQGSNLKVLPPSFRPDLEREIDLYEEVLRIYGMDKIKPTLPKSAKRVGVKTQSQKLISKIHYVMVSCGLHETISYSFANTEDSALLGDNKIINIGKSVELINPMNADQKYMRQSLLPGLLRSVSYNINRGVKNISLYEVGVVFNAKENSQLANERQKIACVLCGLPYAQSWNSKPQAFDFFDAKGVVENILDSLNVQKVRFIEIDQQEAGHLQPGRAALVQSKGNTIGWIGQIHPKLLEKFEIDQGVAAFELDLKTLLSCSNDFEQCQEISNFPGVSIDVAFVVDKDISNEVMLQRIKSAGGSLLKKAHLFDVYESKQHLGDNKKSMAYSLEYNDTTKTLKSEDVEKIHNKLIDKVCKSTGAKLR